MNYTPRKITDIIAIHCSATPPSMDHVNEDEIRQWHLDKGWSDAGYNIVIPRKPLSSIHNYIEIARPLDAQGAHVRGYNHRALGICLVGGVNEDDFPEDNFLPEQWDALRVSCTFALNYASPGAVLAGHTQLIRPGEIQKACPSFDVTKVMGEMGFPVWQEE